MENETVQLSKRDIKRQKIKAKIIDAPDIKYRGIFSYRVLRIFAWISLAVAQILLIHSFGSIKGLWPSMSDGGAFGMGILSSLSTPLFIVASFGLVLSGRERYRHYLLLYGLAFVGVGSGFCIFYARYIVNLFGNIGIGPGTVYDYVNDFMIDKSQINVFADLLAFASFCHFLNYHPKKVFTGKKLIIFRLFMIFPIAYVAVCYILKVLVSFDKLTLSFYFYPFLTTKSPIVFLVFVIVALWIKNRVHFFRKIGVTKEEYAEYLKTNRNSLHFSLHLSITIAVFALAELLAIGIPLLIRMSGTPLDRLIVFLYAGALGIGQTMSMIFAIPFIMLYSYTRFHKNKTIDIAIPIAGVALLALVYLEGIYQIAVNLVGH